MMATVMGVFAGVRSLGFMGGTPRRKRARCVTGLSVRCEGD